MIMRRLARVLWRDPSLLSEHAAGYMRLLSAEGQQFASQAAQRTVWLVAGALLALTALILSGVSLLLGLTQHVEGAALWPYFVVPGGFALVAAATIGFARSIPVTPFESLRRQWAIDRTLFEPTAGMSVPVGASEARPL